MSDKKRPQPDNKREKRKNHDCPERRLRFAREYVVDRNGTRAAMRAGYSVRTAYAQATRLLKNAQVVAEIERLRAEQIELCKIQTSDVIGEIRNLAFSDVGDLVDFTSGEPIVKPANEITPEARRCISKIKIKRIKGVKGGEIVEFHLWDKTQKLKELAQHLGIITERNETTLKGDPASPLYVQTFVEGRKLAQAHRAERVANTTPAGAASAGGDTAEKAPEGEKGSSND